MLAWQLGAKGRYDTVYITASSEQQNLVAPIVASLLSQIREATFARHRADEAADYFTRPPVLWALDEVAGIAPMRDLPETLSQSGGQGLLVAVCLQDLQMARARWDKAADAFLTLFGNVVVHPGIRDRSTLEAINAVVGKHWVTVTSEGQTQNTGRDRQGRNTSDGETYNRTEQQVDRPRHRGRGPRPGHGTPSLRAGTHPRWLGLVFRHALLLGSSVGPAACRHDGICRLVRRRAGALLGAACSHPRPGPRRAVPRSRRRDRRRSSSSATARPRPISSR